MSRNRRSRFSYKPSVKALANRRTDFNPFDLIHRSHGAHGTGHLLGADLRNAGRQSTLAHEISHISGSHAGVKVGSCCSSCASGGGSCGGGLKVGGRSKPGRRRGILAQLKKAFGL